MPCSHKRELFFLRMVPYWAGGNVVYHLSAAIVAAIATMSLLAQPADWTQLRGIEPDQRISAVTQNGKYIHGRFRTWTPDAVELCAGQKTKWLRPVEVKRIWIEKKTPRWHALLIGAAMGFGLAFPIGAASAGYVADVNNPRFGTRAEIGAGFGLFGAGIGAGIGALTGGSKSVLVYRGDHP
jgi:hypothetical protein